MSTNQIIAKLRIENDLDQQDIAKIIDVGYSTYKNYENGILPISLEKLNILSNFYKVSLDYLLGLSKKTKAINFQQEIDYFYLRFSITFLRKRAKINQKNLAKEFGISIRSISLYERDGHLCTTDYLKRIAQKFQISSDYLCGKSLKKEVL